VVECHWETVRPAKPESAITDTEIAAAEQGATPGAIALRHQVHQHPELSNREFETAKLVAARLRALGLDVRTGIAHTGVVGVLKGGVPGPIVAVRSELDALPVTEDSSLPLHLRSSSSSVRKSRARHPAQIMRGIS
jgi:metal-dependent amidase/aminoacylase/carboxypeptidase family protein